MPFSSDFTGNSYAFPSLTYGTTYTVRVQAFSGRSSDFLGDIATVFVSTTFTTFPAAPVLGGTPIDNVSISWSWSQVTGAQYYKLFDIGGSTLYTGSGLSFIQAGLTTNSQYTSLVEAIGV